MNNTAAGILVIDDDPFTLKLIARILANLGYSSVSLGESGHAGLEFIDKSSSPPDLILLDLNMPEMDGIEFVHRLAERRYAGSLILFSGEDEHMLQAAEKLVKLHGIRISGSLHKPVTPEGLATLLERWASSTQAGRQEGDADYSADELRAAISNGELIIFYQPKVELATGWMIGVEALVRWQHPRDGMVLPGNFIGLAERSGLSNDLSRAVLTEALSQANAWKKSGLSLQMAVNISMDNLASPDFADSVSGIAAEAGVAPQGIMLEVAESRISSNDLNTPLETLARLHLKHFRLSLDQFGTGHASEAQLRGIPFDELKVDRKFVHGAWSNRTIEAGYNNCLVLAKQMEMEVVAVGVENESDWDYLRHTGAELAQGYFIARPMPAAELPGWLETWQVRVKDISSL